MTRYQIVRMAHRGKWPLLIERACTADHGMRTNHDLVPMRADVVEAPECRTQHLAAKLLRERDAHCLGLPIGMIGAGPNPESVAGRNDDRLDLARCVGPEHLEPIRLHNVADGVAIEHWHGRGARHANRGQFVNVMIQRRLVASGPPGYDQGPWLDRDLIGLPVEMSSELQHQASSPPLSAINCVTISTPLPVLRLVNTNGRAPRIFLASRAITSSGARTWGARSILLTTRKSHRLMPGPPYERNL